LLRTPALLLFHRSGPNPPAIAAGSPRLDGGPKPADNRVMPVAGQAQNPASVLCQFLDRCLPQRAAVAEDWARRTASAPWTGIWLPDAESRQRIGVAAEIRIGLDLGEVPAYWGLLSFLPPGECSALLGAAGFSSDENQNLAGTGTTDPLLREWRRARQPAEYDGVQRAALAACLDAAGMRNLEYSFSDRSAQARRYFLMLFRSDVTRARAEASGSAGGEPGQDTALDGLVHLWRGYLAHGRQQLAALGSRVILAPELGAGYGVADLVAGRCLVEVKTAFDPAESMGSWLNQVLAYALLDWTGALGIDTIAVYLGWQALLVSDPLARVLAAAAPGPTPSLESLRADFRTAMQDDIDESFAIRMRQRYPPFVTPAPQATPAESGPGQAR
jgi:hypothetical protein